MNYEDIYNKAYNKEYSFFELTIKNDYEKYKLQNRPFSYAQTKAFANFKENFENVKINSIFEDLYILFKRRFELYASNHLQSIFEEIKNKFEAIDQKEEICYTDFNDFIMSIAMLELIIDINRIHSQNINLIEKYYNNNRFDIFEIRQYDKNIESYEHFIELNKIDSPNLYINNDVENEENNTADISEKKPISLPFAIAMLNEIGFFDLPKIKSMSLNKQAQLISIIQQNDIKDKIRNRSISGNISVLNPKSNENQTKYTSYLQVEKVKVLLKQIKDY